MIGRFCQIADDVDFMMNGANHQMNAVSTFPFYILEGREHDIPPLTEMPLKGDTVIENDVWSRQNATIVAGVHIRDGAIIGANSVLASDVKPYTIVAGNLAKPIRKRFNDELIALMLKFQWWNNPIEEINTLIPLFTNSHLEDAKNGLIMRL